MTARRWRSLPIKKAPTSWMETVKRFSLSELARDVRHVAEYSMKFREQGGVITETEALKELLILIAMENRRAVP